MTPARMRPARKWTAATWKELLLSEVLRGVDIDGGKRLRGGEGKIYFNARYYDPTTGRFLTEDPSRKGVNWYAYCENNPVNNTDPTGHQKVDTRESAIDIAAYHGLQLIRADRQAYEAYGTVMDVGTSFSKTGMLMTGASTAGYLAGQPEIGVSAELGATIADALSAFSYVGAAVVAPDRQLSVGALWNATLSTLSTVLDVIPVASGGLKSAAKDTWGYRVGGQFASKTTYGAAKVAGNIPKTSAQIGLGVAGSVMLPTPASKDRLNESSASLSVRSLGTTQQGQLIVPLR